MKSIFFRRACLFFSILVLSLAFTFSAFAHAGKLDKNGGHKSKKSGTYHFHAGSDRKSEFKTKQEAQLSPKAKMKSQPANKSAVKAKVQPKSQPTTDQQSTQPAIQPMMDKK